MIKIDIKGTACIKMRFSLDNQTFSFCVGDRDKKRVSLFIKDGPIDAPDLEIIIDKEELKKVLSFISE